MNKLPWFLFAIISLGLFAGCKKDLVGGEVGAESNFRSDHNSCEVYEHYILETATFTNQVDGNNDLLSDLEIAFYQPDVTKTEIELCLSEQGGHSIEMKFLTPDNPLPDLDEIPKSNRPVLTRCKIENGLMYSYDENNTILSTDVAPPEMFNDVVTNLQASPMDVDHYVAERKAYGATVEFLEDNQMSISYMNEQGLNIIELYDTVSKLMIGISSHNSEDMERTVSLFKHELINNQYKLTSVVQSVLHQSNYSLTELLTRTLTKYTYL